MEVIDEASTKSKKDAKLSKVDSKASDKKKKSSISGLGDQSLRKEDEPEPKSPDFKTAKDIIGDTAGAFSFWGATKKSSKAAEAAKKEAASAKEAISAADKSNLPEAASSGKDTTTSLKSTTTPMKPSTITKKAVGGKVAERLKAFEPQREVVVAPPPPPPPPPSPPKEEKKKPGLTRSATVNSKLSSKKDKEIVEEEAEAPSPKKGSKSKEVPGSFPADGGDEDENIDTIDMGAERRRSRVRRARRRARRRTRR